MTPDVVQVEALTTEDWVRGQQILEQYAEL
jgi:hypothetical protein